MQTTFPGKTAIMLLIIIFSALAGNDAEAGDPSFDCSKVREGSVEALICANESLSRLDREMAQVYAAAREKAGAEHPPVLKAEQLGWIKGRNDCWKSQEQRQCIADNYTRRIVELQARYQLVPASGPVLYSCNDKPADAVIVTYFATKPPTLIAERDDQVSLMYLQPSGSGARYQGRNESLWEHQGEAVITWGYSSPAMRCRLKDNAGQ